MPEQNEQRTGDILALHIEAELAFQALIGVYFVN